MPKGQLLRKSTFSSNPLSVVRTGLDLASVSLLPRSLQIPAPGGWKTLTTMPVPKALEWSNRVDTAASGHVSVDVMD